MRIANVSCYFYLLFNDLQYLVAVMKLFSLPDATLVTQSSQTVYLCNALEGKKAIRVVPSQFIEFEKIFMQVQWG